jgi:hypothetical protein
MHASTHAFIHVQIIHAFIHPSTHSSMRVHVLPVYACGTVVSERASERASEREREPSRRRPLVSGSLARERGGRERERERERKKGRERIEREREGYREGHPICILELATHMIIHII